MIGEEATDSPSLLIVSSRFGEPHAIDYFQCGKDGSSVRLTFVGQLSRRDLMGQLYDRHLRLVAVPGNLPFPSCSMDTR